MIGRVRSVVIVCLLWGGACFVSRAESPTNGLARIALLADTHTLVVTNQRQATFKAHLSRAAVEANAAKVDVVLIAGDLTDGGSPEQMREFRAQLNQFSSPVLYVPGNHDVGNKPAAQREPVVSSEKVETFTKALGPCWFESDLSGIRIIGINASLLGSGLPEESAMWKFLGTKLKGNSGAPVFLLSHYPLFIKSEDEPGNEYYNMPTNARARFLKLLRNGSLNGVLSGHYHRPLVNTVNGHVLLTTPPISFGLPGGKQAEGWTLVTVTSSGELKHEFRYFPGSSSGSD
jgi:3',5'-cyclic AMP phosphodiesterase CpdA